MASPFQNGLTHLLSQMYGREGAPGTGWESQVTRYNWADSSCIISCWLVFKTAAPAEMASEQEGQDREAGEGVGGEIAK